MKQRGRKGLAGLAVIEGGGGLPKPPAHYTDDQAQLWARIVSEKPSDWWDSASLPMLDELVVVTGEIARFAHLVQNTEIASADDVAEYKKMHDIYDKLSAQRKRLMTCLRLSHQSRYNAKNASTAAERGRGRRPWDE